MSTEQIFSLLNISVLPAWALLIFAPKWRVTGMLVHSLLWPLLLGGFYLVTMIAVLFLGIGVDPNAPATDFTTIEGVRNIFASDMGVLIGWAHYLVFDLFVGAWEARDAQRRGFNHWLLIPCLTLTFMFGPVGLVLYLVLRLATGKGGISLAEND